MESFTEINGIIESAQTLSGQIHRNTDLVVDQEYSPTSDNPLSGAAVAEAIGTLDKTDTEVAGQFVSKVSETNGIINVTRKSFDQTYSSTSTNAQSGKAVAEALQNQYKNTLTTPATVTDSNGGKLLNADIIGKSFQDGTPTPTTPVVIQNTGSELKIVSCGINLIPYPYRYGTKTNNGVTYTDNGDGTITLNGTATGWSSFVLQSNLLLPAGKYSAISTTDYLFEVKTIVGTLLTRNGTFSLTVPTNIIISIQSTTPTKEYNNVVVKPMLLRGEYTISTLPTYEKYSAHSYTIPLTDTNGTSHTMRQFDEVKKHSDGKWYFDDNSNLVSFDGTESWSILSEDTNVLRIQKSISYLSGVEDNFTIFCGLSNRLKASTNTEIYKTGAESIIATDYIGKRIKVRLNKSEISDISAWEAQLATWNTAGNPLTVLYKTTTTTSYELSASTSAILDNIVIQKGNANIYFTNAVAPTMNAEYPRDLQLYCNSLEARTESLEDIENQVSQLVTRYGVSFGGSANTGATVTRLYNAVGLVAGVGTDTVNATNDFDNIYPWNARRRCCGAFDADGNFVVNAYKGEPGYIEDGTNGEVWVEHSLFFYKHTYAEDAEEITISATQLAGFLPAPIFVNPDGTLRQKAYTAAYPMATVDGVATSRAGVFPDICSLNSAMTAARTLGANYTVTTTAEWYTECLYMWVEFATRNLQSIMRGASSMACSSADKATVAEEGVNRIIVTNAVAAQYVVGQTIYIGTSLGSGNIANNRIVTAIGVYDTNNKAITFDGTAVNITVGNIVCTTAWINGSCNSVLSSSGSPVSNSSGKYNCVYRGKETPYGNAFEQIADVLFKREGVGTTEDPYTYDVYFLPNPTQYAAGAITDDYVKLNYTVPGTDGYGKKLGFDSRFPWLRIPSELGASTTTYYSDYYFYPHSAVCAACVGGYWKNESNGGLCCWYCYSTSSYSSASYRARLSYHRN